LAGVVFFMIPRGGLGAGDCCWKGGGGGGGGARREAPDDRRRFLIAGEEDEEKEEEEEKVAAAAADARRDDEPGGSCICSGDRSTSCSRKATRLDGLSGGGMTADSRRKKLGM
jgi:hypothetical protein